MIRRIQVLNYRCLRYVDLSLDRFHVLVGPNGSGKRTLLDGISFLGDLVRAGIGEAVSSRSPSFRDLVWGRPERGGRFETAIDVDVPEELRGLLPDELDFRVFRYEVAVADEDGGARIESERGLLMPLTERGPDAQRTLFPDPPAPPSSILMGGGRRGIRTVLNKSEAGVDSFNSETAVKSGKGWITGGAFGAYRSSLGNLPESPAKFPVAMLLRDKLEVGVRAVALDNGAMRRACPPEHGPHGLAPDGSNLPRVIDRFRRESGARFEEWLKGVRTALPDLEDITVVERPDDRHAYLMLHYATGLKVPSWAASSGTLLLLALTLVGHVADKRDTWLIEIPEAGVHPLALDAIRHSITSPHDAQVLVTTYSPALLASFEPSQVLCFAKNADGATDIVRGSEHPAMVGREGLVGVGRLFEGGGEGMVERG